MYTFMLSYSVLGFFRIWHSYLPRSAIGKGLKYLTGIVVGGGSVTFAGSYVLPFLKEHAELILPFALANGVAASFWYCLGEAFLGLDVMLGTVAAGPTSSYLESTILRSAFLSTVLKSVPLVGPVIGVLTAVTAPLLWGAMFAVCWDESLRSFVLENNPHWLLDAYATIAIPVCIPVGLFAGITVQLMLKRLVIGNTTSAVSWVYTSLPVLIAMTSAGALYFSLYKTAGYDYLWELRLDPKTGESQSYNPILDIYKDDREAADKAARKRYYFKVFHSNFTFYFHTVHILTYIYTNCDSDATFLKTTIC